MRIMEKNMENEMEIGVIQGFIGMISNIMVPYSLLLYLSIWHLKWTSKSYW